MFKGSFVALITPMGADGAVDEGALREFVAARTRRDLRELYGSNGIRDDYDHKQARARRART